MIFSVIPTYWDFFPGIFLENSLEIPPSIFPKVYLEVSFEFYQGFLLVFFLVFFWRFLLESTPSILQVSLFRNLSGFFTGIPRRNSLEVSLSSQFPPSISLGIYQRTSLISLGIFEKITTNYMHSIGCFSRNFSKKFYKSLFQIFHRMKTKGWTTKGETRKVEIIES